MRATIGVAACIAVAASVVGAGALDHVNPLESSEGIRELTLAVLSNCAALQTLGNPLTIGFGEGAFADGGLGGIELHMIEGYQRIAPMSHRLSQSCQAPASSRAGAEGMILALDAQDVVCNSSTVGRGRHRSSGDRRQ